ncbi:MAG: N-acetylneuraminate synthase [Candidatus Buchananbacteria bacterium CG10_big_fil_rev_8_21_14_0_10_42_9]|uniref:N-acetylneuraminate synthase n=1 Tax=Candidatus Buchananbacteria bacterium CG10_big_fil_rev_8_21_14_0_10_42_9 TaxID=1974526 RepID=A0A2H0W1P3_9BACT|nr:MAG: N-acetylneuraminate synthase [Candidatus Buchananbacteria bacterium CG10_big_fil_rev_8_21_14_0_10_42_9]
MKTSMDLPSKVKIGNKYIGENEPTYFIAEIGNNHNGDYYLAKKHIQAAVDAGADAVKLQKRSVSGTFTRELLERAQTKDQIFGATYGEYRKRLELNEDEFIHLKRFAEDLGVTFFATPFDKESVDFLEKVSQEVYKIASFDVTNIPLIEYIAKQGKPVILSLGMSTMEEADEAVAAILKYNKQLIIMYCLSIYPTPENKINLLTISLLKEHFSPLPVGYSGHEKGFIPTLAAVSIGAKCVERHFTLNKNLPGPDHATVSIEPSEFKDMVDNARAIEQSLGTPVKKLWDDEIKTREKHSKSIVSATNLPAGTVITEEMIICKSPGYGLKPKMIQEIVGKRIKIDIPADTVLIEDHIEF